MAGRISEITSAVNAYLNSISGTGAPARDVGSEIKGIFRKYFDKALSDVKINTANISADIQNNISDHNFAPKEFQPAKAVDAADNAAKTTNADAYKGLLGTDALRELSDSSYFYSNMVQSSLFKSSDESDENGNKTSLGEASIADLNTRSLLNNTLGITSDEKLYTDYQKALLSAYRNNSIDSIFGEFLL